MLVGKVVRLDVVAEGHRRIFFGGGSKGATAHEIGLQQVPGEAIWGL